MANDRFVFSSLEEVWNFQPEDRGIRSATPEEIRAGLTADVYFVGIQQILDHLHKADTVVTAEIFANHAG
ncbi:MAG: nicotinate phosphoribosyltransferase, partial [Firmicutes bacterium]|nr:nicotinate phosphoribosyltransferase [Bacillota bacterium]